MIDPKKEKKELRKARRARMQDVKRKKGKWLSNATKEDVVKIKRAFPKVIEGMPKAAGGRSAEDLYKDGIVGLYLGEKDETSIS